jgi:hypothetical protein
MGGESAAQNRRKQANENDSHLPLQPLFRYVTWHRAV